MKNTWKIGALLLACAQMPAWAAEKVYTLLSPDKQIKVEITTGGEDLTYSVSFGDTPLLVNSRIGLDAEGLEFTAERASKKERKIDQTVESPFYRFPSFLLRTLPLICLILPMRKSPKQWLIRIIIR